jgi:hypothetical protein
MVTCPSCQYANNPDDAVVCEKCGAAVTLIKDLRASLLRKPTGLLAKSTPQFEAKIRDRHQGKLKRGDLALYIGEAEEPIIIPIMRDMLVGRFGGDLTDMPAGLDLTPYGALESGVSRKHALLRRLGPDIVVIDLGSTNGTWLNGVQLKPQEPITVKSGDRLIFGQLMIHIYTYESS